MPARACFQRLPGPPREDVLVGPPAAGEERPSQHDGMRLGELEWFRRVVVEQRRAWRALRRPPRRSRRGPVRRAPECGRRHSSGRAARRARHRRRGRIAGPRRTGAAARRTSGRPTRRRRAGRSAARRPGTRAFRLAAARPGGCTGAADRGSAAVTRAPFSSPAASDDLAEERLVCGHVLVPRNAVCTWARAR